MSSPHIAAVSFDPALDIEDMSFSWNNREPLLMIRKFSVQCGERVLLQGASGSGKSTLLALMAGVMLPSSGCISVLGRNLTTLSSSRRDTLRASHVGFVFQMFNLLPFLSARDNVLLPCRFSAVRDARARATRSRVEEADHLIASLGLDPSRLASTPVAELSIGQQQRVAAARALIGSPELLLADEPTSALDPATRDSFLQLLFSECARTLTSVVLVSHDPSLSVLFDRSVRLEDLNRPTVPQAV